MSNQSIKEENAFCALCKHGQKINNNGKIFIICKYTISRAISIGFHVSDSTPCDRYETNEFYKEIFNKTNTHNKILYTKIKNNPNDVILIYNMPKKINIHNNEEQACISYTYYRNTSHKKWIRDKNGEYYINTRYDENNIPITIKHLQITYNLKDIE